MPKRKSHSLFYAGCVTGSCRFAHRLPSSDQDPSFRALRAPTHTSRRAKPVSDRPSERAATTGFSPCRTIVLPGAIPCYRVEHGKFDAEMLPTLGAASTSVNASGSCCAPPTDCVLRVPPSLEMSSNRGCWKAPKRSCRKAMQACVLPVANQWHR